MSKVDIYNIEGKKQGSLNLSPQVFGVKINQDLLRQVVNSYASNKRKSIANTKVRSEVRGGGRKPWRQKGTGRARAGSSRSPIWRGGGITFGPTSERNYKKIIPKAIKKEAVRVGLSAKVKDKEIIIIDKLTIKEPKTKLMASVLDKLPFEGTALLVALENKDGISRSTKNIPYLKFISPKSINIFDLLRFKYVILEKSSVKFLEDQYGTQKDNIKKETKDAGSNARIT